MNCGTIDNVTVKTVYISKSSGEFQVFSNITLMHFNGGEEIADQDLDRGEEGYFMLSLSLDAGTYSVRVVTGRGSTFDHTFVP
ncbi:MAG: hypothetical protein QMD13_09775, partial [Candidatus Bathyarchaeia archaeon]|nr:hypothetical protein [Candidatus Bathyarchaeia archaeon]